MEIVPEELEAMLQRREKEMESVKDMSSRTTGRESEPKNGTDASPAKPLLFDEIVREMNSFMGNQSDYSGVELDGEGQETRSAPRSKFDHLFTPEFFEQQENLMNAEEKEVDDEAFLAFFRDKYGSRILGEESSDEEEFYNDEKCESISFHKNGYVKFPMYL